MKQSLKQKIDNELKLLSQNLYQIDDLNIDAGSGDIFLYLVGAFL